jgi:plasmid stabilization system protein ParE
VTAKLFTPRASRELTAAAAWIAEDNPDAAENLLSAAITAATRVTKQPMLARVELRLAPNRYRFWSLRGYPYLLVIDTENDPPVVARFVHQTRDLPALLDEL